VTTSSSNTVNPFGFEKIRFESTTSEQKLSPLPPSPLKQKSLHVSPLKQKDISRPISALSGKPSVPVESATTAMENNNSSRPNLFKPRGIPPELQQPLSIDEVIGGGHQHLHQTKLSDEDATADKPKPTTSQYSFDRIFGENGNSLKDPVSDIDAMVQKWASDSWDSYEKAKRDLVNSYHANKSASNGMSMSNSGSSSSSNTNMGASTNVAGITTISQNVGMPYGVSTSGHVSPVKFHTDINSIINSNDIVNQANVVFREPQSCEKTKTPHCTPNFTSSSSFSGNLGGLGPELLSSAAQSHKLGETPQVVRNMRMAEESKVPPCSLEASAVKSYNNNGAIISSQNLGASISMDVDRLLNKTASKLSTYTFAMGDNGGAAVGEDCSRNVDRRTANDIDSNLEQIMKRFSIASVTEETSSNFVDRRSGEGILSAPAYSSSGGASMNFPGNSSNSRSATMDDQGLLTSTATTLNDSEKRSDQILRVDDHNVLMAREYRNKLAMGILDDETNRVPEQDNNDVVSATADPTTAARLSRTRLSESKFKSMSDVLMSSGFSVGRDSSLGEQRPTFLQQQEQENLKVQEQVQPHQQQFRANWVHQDGSAGSFATVFSSAQPKVESQNNVSVDPNTTRFADKLLEIQQRRRAQKEAEKH